MSATELAAYVGSTAPSDTTFLEGCWAEAEELVDVYVGTASVPPAIAKRATMEVAAELFHRRQAPGGITQFAALDGSSPVRMARDPMLGAYPILARYVPAGLA